MSTCDTGAKLYPHALGSLFVAFYDSQGYGGGIRNRLHTGRRLISAMINLGYDVIFVVYISYNN
jgi:hypothetical protein